MRFPGLPVFFALCLVAGSPAFSAANIGLYCPVEDMYYCSYVGENVGAGCWVSVGWQCASGFQVEPLPNELIIKTEDIPFWTGYVMLIFVLCFGVRVLKNLIMSIRG